MHDAKNMLQGMYASATTELPTGHHQPCIYGSKIQWIVIMNRFSYSCAELNVVCNDCQHIVSVQQIFLTSWFNHFGYIYPIHAC